MSRRKRREQRQATARKSIRWAAELHKQLVCLTPPDNPRNTSELTKHGNAMGMACAIPYGNGALIRVLSDPTIDIRWKQRQFIHLASIEERTMARLRGEFGQSPEPPNDYSYYINFGKSNHPLYKVLKVRCSAPNINQKKH